MKTILKKTSVAGTLILAFCFLFSGSSFAQKKKETIVIKTSAQCEKCKKRIEDAVMMESGVKSADLDVKTGEIKVTYIDSKTNADAIRTIISKIGYDADSIPADHDAYHKLPTCCQKDGHSH